MLSLDGIDLQVNQNGYVSREITFVDYTRFWFSTSFEASCRGSDDSMRLETTLYNGKKVFSKYANTACKNSISNFSPSDINNKYSKLILVSHMLQGTALSLTDISNLYTKYIKHQKYWSDISLIKQKLQDPDIQDKDKDNLLNEFKSLTYPDPIALDMPLNISKVFFAEGSSFEYTIWSTGEFCDFKFIFVEFKPFCIGENAC